MKGKHRGWNPPPLRTREYASPYMDRYHGHRGLRPTQPPNPYFSPAHKEEIVYIRRFRRTEVKRKERRTAAAKFHKQGVSVPMIPT